MKPFFKHGLCLIALASLSACSSTDTTQATGNFDYLDQAAQPQWKNIPGHEIPESSAYQIPTGQYQGQVGEAVNISPPLQLLSLIPGGRYESNPFHATFLLPDAESVKRMNQVLKVMADEKSIPILNSSEKGIETFWIPLDEDGELQVRHLITPVEKDGQYGVQITLAEFNRNGTTIEPTDFERENYNVMMANKILTRYEDFVLDKVQEESQENANDIAISIGADRTGNDVIIARASYDSFWDSLPVVLQPLGFTLEERNRSQGTLVMSYAPPKDELWQQLDVEPVELERRNYQIQLGDLGNRTSINILDNKGVPIDKAQLVALGDALSAIITTLNNAPE